MTTPSHILQGGLIAHLLFYNWIFTVIAMILSLIPDISPLYQVIVLGRKREEIRWDGFYLWAHTTPYLLFIPFWNLHIIEDFLSHHREGGINKYYLPMEVTIDTTLVITVLKIGRIL